MAPETASAERAEKILQRFEAKEVDGLVRDFETNLRLIAVHWPADAATRRGFIGRGDLRRLLRIDKAFLGHAFHQFVNEVANLFVVHRVGALQHLAHFFREGVFVEEVAFLQRTEDGFAERFHRTLGIELVHAVELRFETGLEEEIAELFDELFEVDGVGGFAGVFREFGEFHGRETAFTVDRLRFAVKTKETALETQLILPSTGMIYRAPTKGWVAILVGE